MILKLTEQKLYTKIFIFFVVFFFIFGMKTPVGSLAQIFTVFICFFGFFIYRNYFFKPSKAFLFLILFLIYDFIICAVWAVFFGTYDFNILTTKTNFILSVFATYILGVFFFRNYEKKDFFVLLSLVFLVQSLIIIAMLLNPSFSDFIMTYTKDSNVTERMLNNYSGARGLGLADSAAFGFSVVMAIFLLLSLFSYKKGYISGKYFFILIFLGIVASISAGRVSLLGAILGSLFLILNYNKPKIFMLTTSLFFGSLFLFLFLISLRNTNIEPQALATLYNYSMEPIFNYIDYGELKSSSTDALLQRMYFPLNEKQLLIGDARYVEGDKYYMSTDAGYMRFSLFYGAINSMVLYLSYLLFSLFVFLRLKDLDEKILIILMVLLSFFLHYKGEIILFAVSYNKLLLLVVFFLYMKSLKN